jgi:hypothetical protein
MATPPTRVQMVQPAVGFLSNASPKTTPTFDVQSGDLLVCIGQWEGAFNGTAVNAPTWTGTGTWTQRVTAGSLNNPNNSYVAIWSCDVTATATARTVSLTTLTGATTMDFGFTVTQWRAHGGVGVTNSTALVSPSTGTPSLSLTTSDGSAVQCGNDDWSAQDGTSRVWRTVNGSAMTESLYARNTTNYAAYAAYAPDTGSAGTTTVGLTAPTGQTYAIAGIEILGTAGTTAPPDPYYVQQVGVPGRRDIPGNVFAFLTPPKWDYDSGELPVTAAVSMDSTSTMDVTGGAQTIPATVTMAGASSMAVTGNQTISAAESMDSTSTMLAGGKQTISAAATMASTSAMAVTQSQTELATVTMAGTSTLSVVGFQTITATVAMASTSAMSEVPTNTAAVTMAQTSAMAVTALVTHPYAVAMAQSSTLTVVGLQTISASATMAQSSAMAVTIQVIRTTAVTMAQTSTMAVSGKQTIPTAVAFASTSAMTEVVSGFNSATVAMAQTSTMAVVTQITRVAAITMAQTSAMGVVAMVIQSGQVGFTSTSAMTLASTHVVLAAALMAQVSTMVVSTIPPRDITIYSLTAPVLDWEANGVTLDWSTGLVAVANYTPSAPVLDWLSTEPVI